MCLEALLMNYYFGWFVVTLYKAFESISGSLTERKKVIVVELRFTVIPDLR